MYLYGSEISASTNAQLQGAIIGHPHRETINRVRPECVIMQPGGGQAAAALYHAAAGTTLQVHAELPKQI